MYIEKEKLELKKMLNILINLMRKLLLLFTQFLYKTSTQLTISIIYLRIII